MIDLRSDTVTKPTPEMLKAISSAPVGDDFFRDDPTVIALEEEAATILGKQSAVLVLSGTMGNIVSVLALAGRGGAMIAEASSHILINESGWPAAIGGITAIPITGNRGLIFGPQLEAQLAQSKNRLSPPVSLLCLENTHNAAGGRVMRPELMVQLLDIAKKNALKVHLDGARLFNAAISLGLPVSKLAEGADTVTFCFTKGLSCPAGSIVAGNSETVAEIRRWRQVIGGGMRQAGIFAAAGRVALKTMIERLADDHRNAQALASILSDAGLDILPSEVETNILFVRLPTGNFNAAVYLSELLQKNILVSPPKNGRVRFVTHREISSKAIIDAAPAIVAAFLEAQRAPAEPGNSYQKAVSLGRAY